MLQAKVHHVAGAADVDRPQERVPAGGDGDDARAVYDSELLVRSVSERRFQACRIPHVPGENFRAGREHPFPRQDESAHPVPPGRQAPDDRSAQMAGGAGHQIDGLFHEVHLLQASSSS